METQKCGNCKYFCQHYAWTCGRFCEIDVGHCKNRRPNKQNVCKPSQDGCEMWEDNAEQMAERLARLETKAAKLGK